jgi:hypothetical protein
MEFQKPNIKKDTFVAVDIENDEAIPMQIDVVFPKCPCACKFLILRRQCIECAFDSPDDAPADWLRDDLCGSDDELEI